MAEAKKDQSDLEAAYQDIMKDLDQIWESTVGSKEPKKEPQKDPKGQ